MRKTIHTNEQAAFIGRLRKGRQESSLTQAQVAEKLGTSQSWLSKIEHGELRVDIITLNRLAKLYKKKLSYFL